MKVKAPGFISVSLATFMVASTLAGTSYAAQSSSSTSNVHRTLTVEVFDRGVPGQPDLNNNYWTTYINNNFGKQYNATVKFVTVPRSQEVPKLNVMMAAGQAPDISFTYDTATVYNYVQEGGLADLGPDLKQYGSTLTKYLGNDVLKYGKFNGKQYAVPGKRTVLAGLNTFIRKDWLDKLGLPLPTTPTQFYNDMVAFKEKNPGNVSGVIPFGYNLDPNNPGVGYIPEAFKPSKLTKKQFATLQPKPIWDANWNLPGFENAVSYMNKMYNAGLVSPGFAIDKDGSQLNADISNGKVGAFFTNWDGPYRTSPGDYTNLKKNVPGAELVPVDPWRNDAGKYPKNGYSPNGMYIIVPKSSKNVDLAVEYLNWMAQPKNTLFLQNGKNGVDYHMVKGIPEPTGTTTSGNKMMTVANNLDYDILSNGIELGSAKKDAAAISAGYPGYQKDAANALKVGMKGYYHTFFYSIPNAADAQYGTSLTSLSAQMLATLIVAKPADVGSQYKSLVLQYMSQGGQQVQDEYIKNYKAQTGK